MRTAQVALEASGVVCPLSVIARFPLALLKDEDQLWSLLIAAVADVAEGYGRPMSAAPSDKPVLD